MIFLGYDFLANSRILAASGDDPSLSSISITNGLYDSVYLSSDTEEFESPELKWKDTTMLFATFDKRTLVGSNFEYGSELYSIQLKRREIGHPWVLLYEQIVRDANDINFVYNDNFARGNDTEFEYALIPILKNGTELPYIKTKVRSDFTGAVIADGLKSYHVLLDSAVTKTVRNHQMSVITTLNGKFPYVFCGSESNYTTGTFEGTIIKYNGSDSFDVKHSHWYREEFKNWLTNGEPKFLKTEDGRAWMVVVTGSIDDDRQEHIDKAKFSFEFNEIGDINDSDDMANNNLTNVTSNSAGQDAHIVTNNLLYVTTDNPATVAKDRGEYIAVLTALQDYEISGVIVMLGGVNITSSVYNRKTHRIYVPSVTANLTIVASATRVRIPITSISFSESEVSVYIGNSHTLNPVIKPIGADTSNIRWQSENPAIATVTKGTIVGVSTGTTTIRAYADGQTASVNVVVRK